MWYWRTLVLKMTVNSGGQPVLFLLLLLVVIIERVQKHLLFHLLSETTSGCYTGPYLYHQDEMEAVSNSGGKKNHAISHINNLPFTHVFLKCSLKKKETKKTLLLHLKRASLNHASLNWNGSLSLYWQPGYHVSCCSIWSDFGSSSDCLSHPPRLVLTLMSESWRAPLVSSCVAKAISCKSKGQEGGRHGGGAEDRGFSCTPRPPQAFFKSRCCKTKLLFQILQQTSQCL